MDAPEVVHPSDQKYYAGKYHDFVHDAPEVRPSHDPEHYYGTQYHDAGPPTYPNEILNEKRICGFKPKSFWIILAVFLVVVAGAVGGGVGGGLEVARQNQQKESLSSSSRSSSTSTFSQEQASTLSTTSPTSTTTHTSSISTTTSTSTTSSTSAASTALFNDSCSPLNDTIFTPFDTSAANAPFSISGTTLTYKVLCYTNFASKSSGHNPNITEILRQESIPTLQDCITLCAAYNKALTSPTLNTLCSIPVFIGAPNNVTKCFLQSGTAAGAESVGFDATQSEIDSAVLQFPGLS